ncbi:MAG: hypothetical protein ACREPY_08240 [Rhodanobacteraceae bacterium]
MITKKAVSHAPRHWPAARNTLLMLGMLGAGVVARPAFATSAYDAGPLNFATQNQSMWGTNNAFVKSGSQFVGTPFGGGQTFGGFVLGTGAEVGYVANGKLGLNFGYTVDSGSVDANVGFGATAQVPHTVQQQQFFNLGTNSALSSGTIKTQSPDATADMSLVANFNGLLFAKGCFLGACSSSATPLPSINIDQKLLALTPNELEILPDVIPNGADDGSVAHVPLGSEEVPIQWEGSEIGTFSTNVPNVTTLGGVNGSSISSSGSDPLLTATIDVPDLSSLVGIPTNFEADLGPLEVGLAPVDLNIGPQLSLGQDFDLDPTLMVDLAFSRPVEIAGEAGPQSSWDGAWADLPSLALFGTTTFTPTFWLDAPLTNNTNLDLGLIGTYDFLKFELKLGDIDISESLSGLLGLDGKLFSTPTLNFPIWDNTFQLGGFSAIAAKKFTIYTGSATAVPEPPDLPLFLLGLGALPLLVYLGKKCDSRDANRASRAKGVAHA